MADGAAVLRHGDHGRGSRPWRLRHERWSGRIDLGGSCASTAEGSAARRSALVHRAGRRGRRTGHLRQPRPRLARGCLHHSRTHLNGYRACERRFADLPARHPRTGCALLATDLRGQCDREIPTHFRCPAPTGSTPEPGHRPFDVPVGYCLPDRNRKDSGRRLVVVSTRSIDRRGTLRGRTRARPPTTPGWNSAQPSNRPVQTILGSVDTRWKSSGGAGNSCPVAPRPTPTSSRRCVRRIRPFLVTGKTSGQRRTAATSDS